MKKKFAITVLILIILRALDLFLTYLYNPNLNYEYNPIVSIFGASWTGLIGMQLIVLLIVAFFAWYYFKLPAVKVAEENLNFPDFVYCFFSNQNRPWPDRIFSKPTNVKSHIIFVGFMVTASAILVSLFAIINNTLILRNTGWYLHFLAYHYKLFFPVVYFMIIMGSFFLFFAREYKTYLKTQKRV